MLIYYTIEDVKQWLIEPYIHLVFIMYRLYHEVEVSTRFTHRGLKARGCVNRVETEPSDITDLYHDIESTNQCHVTLDTRSYLAAILLSISTLSGLSFHKVNESTCNGEQT